MSETPNMIKVFPGSDDSRGTTTRVIFQTVQDPETGFGPEMRPDEYEGIVGDNIRNYNFTRQNIGVIAYVNAIDTTTNTNQYFSAAEYHNFRDAIERVEAGIQAVIDEICIDLGIDPITFYLTKVDILSTSFQVMPQIVDTAKATLFYTFDSIIYGQFSPNPFVPPAPPVVPCECYTPIFTTTLPFSSANNNGTLTSNLYNMGTPTAQNGNLYVKALGRVALGARAIAQTADFLTPNSFYTLKYDISANLQPILTPGTNIELQVKVNNVIVNNFVLDTNAQSGYFDFVAPTGWTNPYTVVEFTYTKAFGDRTNYNNQTLWHVNFQICNQYCEL